MVAEGSSPKLWKPLLMTTAPQGYVEVRSRPGIARVLPARASAEGELRRNTRHESILVGCWVLTIVFGTREMNSLIA